LLNRPLQKPGVTRRRPRRCELPFFVTVPAQGTSTITVPIALAAKPRAVIFAADVSLLGVLRQ
jgi:hypothetical protein